MIRQGTWVQLDFAADDEPGWTTWTIPGCIPRAGDAVVRDDGVNFMIDEVRWDLNADPRTDPVVSLSVIRLAS